MDGGIFAGIGIMVVLVIIMIVVFVVQGNKKQAQQQSMPTQYAMPTMNASVCSGCGKGVNAEMTFCPGCGTQTNNIAQPQTQVASNMACAKCGNTDLHFGTTEVKQKRNAGGRFVNLVMFVATSIWAVITLAFWVMFGAASLGFGFFMMAAYYARRKKMRTKALLVCKRCGNQWVLE